MTDSILIRASSVPAWLDCPARAHAIYIEGRRMPGSLQAALGTAVHAGTAVFDTERVGGGQGNLTAAMDAAADSLNKPREDIALEADDRPDQALDIAVSLTEKYCSEVAPDHQYHSVELEIDALPFPDLGITLTGTTDRIRITSDGLGVADVKTGKSAVNSRGECKTTGHAAQLGVYELLAEAALGVKMQAAALVIGMQTNLTREKQRIATGEIWRPSEVLTGDAFHTGVLPVIAKFAKGEVAYGNPKSYLCSDRYCPVWNNCFWRK